MPRLKLNESKLQQKIIKQILKLIGLNKSESTENIKLSIKPCDKNNYFVASGFEGVVDGLQFSPTFHFKTPSEILRADGMCVDDHEHIPEFLREQRYGAWLPKVKLGYSFLEKTKDVGASDSGFDISRDDYISYVCGVKEIYLGSGNIFERASKIKHFCAQHPELLYVEEKLLKSYKRYNSIIDILLFLIGAPYKDIVLYRFDDKNYLIHLFGVNTRIEKSFISNGYETAKDIVSLSKEQLLKLDEIGSKSADKIVEKIEEIINITSKNYSEH